MFVIIETNGATHIAIHVPHADAEKALPALAGMLESNTTFLRKDWREVSIVKPHMTIQLGAAYTPFDASDNESQVTVAAPDAPTVLREGLTVATPEVLTSNRKAIDSLTKQLSDSRAEVSVLKNQLSAAKEQIDALTAIEGA